MARRKTKRNKIVTEEKLALVNKFNIELLQEFLSYLRTIDRSPQSILTYDSDIKIFYCWLLECGRNKDFTEITKRDVMKYQDFLLNTLELSPARIRHLKSAISSMSNYIETILDDEYPTFRNIVNKIQPPTKREVREKTVLTDENIQTLLDYFISKEKYQQACLIACLCGSGMRKSEIVQLEYSWFKEENVVHGLYRTEKKIRCKGRGKEGKQKFKYLSKDIVDKCVDLWLKQREKLGVDCESLFVTRYESKWQQASTGMVDSCMDKCSEILQIPIYCHAFRHYLATYLYKNKVDINQIKELLGHESSATTEIYIDIDEEDNLQGMFTFLGNDEQEDE